MRDEHYDAEQAIIKAAQKYIASYEEGGTISTQHELWVQLKAAIEALAELEKK